MKKHRISLVALVEELGKTAEFARDAAGFLRDAEALGIPQALAKTRRWRIRVHVERTPEAEDPKPKT